MKQLKIELAKLQLHDKYSDLVKPKTLRGKKLYAHKFHNKLNYGKLFNDMDNKLKETEQLLSKNPQIWVIDYTSMSCTKLETKKNRYLLNRNGNYFVKGYLVALNLKTRKTLVIETEAKQMAKKDILELNKHLPKGSIICSDKQHKELVYLVSKQVTQTIENYFRPLKREIYKQIKEYQTYVQFIKNKRKQTFIVTNIPYEQLNDMYEQLMNKWRWRIVKKAKPKIENKGKPSNKQ